jgi:Ca-activated chloride channel family protein
VEAFAMNFVNSRVLWAIPVVIAGVIWFLWWSWRKRQALVRLFVSERLVPQLLEGYSPTRRKLKMGLQVAAVLFLMLALARPQWGFIWEEANTRGRDILIAIDTSRSMLATDMAPNRLMRAKLAALDLLRLAKNDRLGLIAFSGAAFLQCPLTLDDRAFRQNVDALDTSIIPQGGTAITEAIQTAVTTFETEEGDNHKVLVIFTDGEDHESGAVIAAEHADNRHLKIFTVGVGTPAGELVKLTDERGNSTFLKDENGNVVKSRLNEDLLRQIATAAKGFYIPLREGNAMQVLYQRGLEPLPTSDVSSKLVRQLKEQFHWPLGIAIALLLIEALLPAAAKKRGATAVTTGGVTAKATLAAMILLMAITTATASPARAYRDYKKGNFKESQEEYTRELEKKPDDPKLNYNAGAAAYRAGEYDAAAKAFNNATKAPELDLQEMAYYNLGNANYRLGTGQPAPDKKMALWHEAVQNFESALKLNPQDADAQFNRDLVKQELEKLKQQQKQKNQDKNDNKDQNKDDKNQNDKDQQKQNKDESQDKKDQNQEKQDQKDNQDSKSDEEKKKEEQQKQEQQQKDQEQQQQAQNDKKEGEEQEKPQAKNQGEKDQANQDQKSDQQREGEQEARAAQLAQMTPKQAQQMLDAQKTEEKAVIYRQYDERKKSRNRIFKDW